MTASICKASEIILYTTGNAKISMLIPYAVVRIFPLIISYLNTLQAGKSFSRQHFEIAFNSPEHERLKVNCYDHPLSVICARVQI